MIQGVDTDGDLGPGWEGATDSEENPMDPRIRELMAAEGMDDKLEVGGRTCACGGGGVNELVRLCVCMYG